MSRTITGMKTEDVGYEAPSGYDGQGKPSFAASVTLSARVVRKESYVLDAEGSQIPTHLTLYFPPTVSVAPREQSRITLTEGDVFTIREVTSPRAIGAARSSEPDHYRAKCSRGG
jgi:hypothetical protein